MKKVLLFLIVSSLAFVTEAIRDGAVTGDMIKYPFVLKKTYDLQQYTDLANHLLTVTIMQHPYSLFIINKNNEHNKKRAMSPHAPVPSVKRQVSFNQDNKDDGKKLAGLSIRRPQSLISTSQSSLNEHIVDIEGSPTPKTPEKDGGMKVILRLNLNDDEKAPSLSMRRPQSLISTSQSSLNEHIVDIEGSPTPKTPEKDGGMRLRSYSNVSARSRASSSESFAGDFYLGSISKDSLDNN